jgi:methanogenic corrinoid protein MtbC1
MQLRPVTYESKNKREEGLTFAGLIAEEVHDLGLTEFVQYAEDGSPDALAYANMIALLTKAIQEQQTQIEALKTEIEILKNK